LSQSQPFQQLVLSIPLGIGKADDLSNGVEAYRVPAQRRRDQRVPRPGSPGFRAGFCELVGLAPFGTE
jgi:hypothetical protein